MQQDPIIPARPTNTTDDENQVIVGSGYKRRGGLHSALSTIAILVAAPLIAITLTSFVFQSYEVDGPSMNNTLQNHDRLIVWKVPRTIAKITGGHFVPNRGDVIVFVRHGLYELGSDQERQLIKRVIGVPGDRVVVADNKITVYNKDSPGGFNPDERQDFSPNIISPTSGNVDITVGENEVFVNGDNRVNSLDSRVFGTVQSSDIVGRMVLRIFPIGNFKSYI